MFRHFLNFFLEAFLNGTFWASSAKECYFELPRFIVIGDGRMKPDWLHVNHSQHNVKTPALVFWLLLSVTQGFQAIFNQLCISFSVMKFATHVVMGF